MSRFCLCPIRGMLLCNSFQEVKQTERVTTNKLEAKAAKTVSFVDRALGQVRARANDCPEKAR